MKKTLTLFVLLSLIGWSLAGCGTPTSPDEVLDSSSKNLTTAANNIVTAVNAIQNMDEYDSLFKNIGDLTIAEGRTSREPDPRPGPNPKPGPKPGERKVKPPKMNAKKLTEKDTKEFLEKYVFNEANIVSKTSTEVTYKIEGDNFCKMFSRRRSQCTSGNGKKPVCKTETTVPQECIDMVNEQDVQLIVSQPDKDTVSVKVVLKTATVIELLVGSKKVEIKLFLGTIHKAMTAYAAANPKAKLPKEFPTSVEGAVSLALGYSGTLTFDFSIIEALSVEGKAEGEKYSFSLAKQASILSASYDKNAKKLSWGINFNQIKAALAAKLFDSKEKGLVEIALGGISASMTLAAKQAFKVTNIGLGTTTSSLKINGKTIAKVDLNPKHTRKFSLTLKRVGDKPELSISPAFDLQAFIDLSSIAEAAKEVGKWAKGNTLQIFLDGGGKDAIILPIKTTGKDRQPTLKVKAGTLKIKNITTKKELTVLQGACLQLKKDTRSSDDSFLGFFASVACP